MVVTRPGQDPVCYQEVIVPQRSAEEKPRQDGEQKPTRKRAVRTESETGKTATLKATRSVATRKKATGEVAGLDSTSGVGKEKVTKKTTTRTTAKRASATTTAKASRRPSTTAKKITKKT